MRSAVNAALMSLLLWLSSSPAAAVDVLGPDDFEVGFGNWSNIGGDVFDWTREGSRAMTPFSKVPASTSPARPLPI
jgi:hypothetical protein